MALWTQLDAALAANSELVAKVEALTTRVAELEAKVGEPPKTPDNSSVPPSHGHKANKPPRHKRRKGRRPGVARQLHPNPDHIVEARAETCPSCATALTEGDQKLQSVYERIELPPIKPIVTQVRLHGGTCRHCGRAFTAPTPASLPPGSPFGSSIEAVAVYLRYCHAIGFVPLSKTGAELLFEVFSQRYERGSILVTSNLPFDEWTEIFGGTSDRGFAGPPDPPCPYPRNERGKLPAQPKPSAAKTILRT